MLSWEFWKWLEYGETRPAFLEFRSSRGFIVSTVSLAAFTDIFLYGLVIPVFPFALERRAGIHHDHIQLWVSVLLAVYGAGVFIASPVCGYLADMSSNRRSSLLAGILTLTGATVLLCLGSHIAVLVIGRFLQGVSAAIVWSVGLALIADTMGKDGIARSMGIVSAAMSGGIFLAPLLGGIVYDSGGYYAVFSMAFALLAIDIVLRLILIEQKIAAKYLATPISSGKSSPRTGSSGVLSGGSLRSPSGSPRMPKSDSEGSDLMAMPTGGERNARENTPNDIEAGPPMQEKHSRIPPIVAIMRYPRLLVALWGGFTQAILMTSLETTLPLRAQELFNFNATGAGLIILAVVLPTFLAPVVGWACDKWGTRWVQTAGFLLGCPFFVFLRFPNYHSVSQIALMCAILALNGIGLVLVMPAIMAEISLFLNKVEEDNPGIFGSNGAYAQGYGLFNVAFSAGTLVGPLWSGLVKDAVGWNTMVWTIGLLSFITAIPTVIYTGGKISRADIMFRGRRGSG